MALDALKHRDVAEVNWMLKWLVRLVTELAFAIGEASEIDRMLESSGPRILFWRSSRVVDHRVADVAIIPDHFARIANMLAIMATETARRIEMADVVGMRLPIRFHLREKVRLEDALNLFDAGLNGLILVRINFGVIGSIELIQA
jgi:hypothetical protein